MLKFFTCISLVLVLASPVFGADTNEKIIEDFNKTKALYDAKILDQDEWESKIHALSFRAYAKTMNDWRKHPFGPTVTVNGRKLRPILPQNCKPEDCKTLFSLFRIYTSTNNSGSY